eukprot:comp21641_c0_seq1/m.47869 comp21641_c0_seq1/g.47869  ORF comp21641_c0_seq1/g.47869 comp21641_c0_seq1/m.47869 type:complete len:355 (+) comp21641_c0_seq1:57-1121(+)
MQFYCSLSFKLLALVLEARVVEARSADDGGLGARDGFSCCLDFFVENGFSVVLLGQRADVGDELVHLERQQLGHLATASDFLGKVGQVALLDIADDELVVFERLAQILELGLLCGDNHARVEPREEEMRMQKRIDGVVVEILWHFALMLKRLDKDGPVRDGLHDVKVDLFHLFRDRFGIERLCGSSMLLAAACICGLAQCRVEQVAELAVGLGDFVHHALVELMVCVWIHLRERLEQRQPSLVQGDAAAEIGLKGRERAVHLRNVLNDGGMVGDPAVKDIVLEGCVEMLHASIEDIFGFVKGVSDAERGLQGEIWEQGLVPAALFFFKVVCMGHLQMLLAGDVEHIAVEAPRDR